LANDASLKDEPPQMDEKTQKFVVGALLAATK
jgi:hypothetical protein